VEVEYPLALLNALASVIITKRFRYMHVSGILAEANQSKSLWFMEEGRHIKVRRKFSRHSERLQHVVR
jgi:hypothetical protein